MSIFIVVVKMKRFFRPSQYHGITEVVNHIELVYAKIKKKKRFFPPTNIGK